MNTRLTRFVGVVLVLTVGAILGVALQKYYRVGNTLESLGSGNRPFPAPTTLAVGDSIPEELQGKLSLFILAGQSNMSGRGEVAKSGQDSNSMVFVFGNDYHWKIAEEPIDDPSGQVDKVSEDPDASLGPGLAFATSLIERRPDMAIGLIPCASGGSSIYQWRRSLSENTLYGSCLKRARAASTMGDVAGILFFQGEADAMAPELYQETVLLPDEWGDRFVALVNNWRQDLNSPELPVVFAQIGTNTAPDIFVNWAAVKEQQASVEMPFCGMITTDDLALKDGVHFTSESYQIIGRRFAEAYSNLIREQVLLRYTPQVGSTYRYKLKINRPHDPIEVIGEMRVLSKDEEGYQIRFSGMLDDELFSESMAVSDRHNSSHPGYISLNFPDAPVGPGAEWGGEVPWYFENYYVLDPTENRLPASYKLVMIEQDENGRYAIIEQWIEADVVIDGLILHVGQVGVGWDREGRITEVHQGYDGLGRLQVGDVVVGINGQRAGAAGGLDWLAEKYIQRPKDTKTVTFTVLRHGKEYDIEVEKSIDRLAAVKVYNMKGFLKIKYDVDRGILLSAEVSNVVQDIAFTLPTADTFPVVDDYDGFHKFGYLRGKTAYQTRLGSDEVAWTLSLVE
jgi:hypothetical protein